MDMRFPFENASQYRPQQEGDLETFVMLTLFSASVCIAVVQEKYSTKARRLDAAGQLIKG